VKPGHADVVQSVDLVPHQLGGDHRLLGHAHVGGARRDDQDRPIPRSYIVLLQGDSSGDRVEHRGGDLAADGLVRGFGGAGHQQRLAPGDYPGGNGRDVGRTFACTEDDLGEPLSQGPVVIHPGEPQVLERQLPQVVQQLSFGFVGGQGPVLDLVEERANGGQAHSARSRGWIGCD